MRATGNVITETLVSDSALKVVLFSTLYADVKEPAPGQSPGREVQTLKFLPAVKLKTVISASWRRPRFYGGGDAHSDVPLGACWGGGPD